MQLELVYQPNREQAKEEGDLNKDLKEIISFTQCAKLFSPIELVIPGVFQ